MSDAEPRTPLLKMVCGWCGGTFGVCFSCFRGQRYCSNGCRNRSRVEQDREADRKYQQTPAGAERHRERQREYRLRQGVAGVTEQGSGAAPLAVGTLRCDTVDVAVDLGQVDETCDETHTGQTQRSGESPERPALEPLCF